MKVISSKDNSIIKEVRSLQEKKYRDNLGMYLVEGPNLVKELMEYGGRPRFIFTKAGANDEVKNIVSMVKEPTAIYELTEDVFSKISTETTPQGIIAVANKIKYSEQEFFNKVGKRNVLVLDRTQDPGNLGTLIRSAEALGFGGIILVKGCADPYQPKVVRAAAGCILRMPMLYTSDAEETAKLLKDAGKTLYAACMEGAIPLYEADLRENTAIVIGNEGNGVSKELMELSIKLFIPMEGETESLNAAIAGTIIMYESKRQRF